MDAVTAEAVSQVRLRLLRGAAIHNDVGSVVIEVREMVCEGERRRQSVTCEIWANKQMK
jgi:hypothetical protein